MAPENNQEEIRCAVKTLSEAVYRGIVDGLATSRLKGTQKPQDSTNPLLQEPNICRGLNLCRGKGQGDGSGGPNACAGQSICATATNLGCATSNDCRGLGACDVVGDGVEDNYPGENTCRGRGSCAVPIREDKDHVWQKVRKRFESLMTDTGRTFGPAPPRPTP